MLKSSIDYYRAASCSPDMISEITSLLSLPDIQAYSPDRPIEYPDNSESIIVARDSDGITGFVETRLIQKNNGIIIGQIPLLHVKKTYGKNAEYIREKIVTELLIRAVDWLKTNGATRLELGLWSTRMYREFRDCVLTLCRPDIN